MHVHIEFEGKVAKIWLDNFEIAEDGDFKLHQLREIQKLTRIMKKSSKKPGSRILDEEFDAKFDKEMKRALKAPKRDVKIRVNTFIDLDIYEALNEEAEKTGQKYQTLLNKYLRAAVLKEISEADIKAIKIALSR